MSIDGSIKALLIAVGDDPSLVLYTINRLVPDFLCLVLPHSSRSIVETDLQSGVTKMPNRWDWVLCQDAHDFQHVHQELGKHLPSMLKTWGIHQGELAVDFSAATPGMAAAMVLVSRTMSSRIVQVGAYDPERSSQVEQVEVDGMVRAWRSCNLWDEEAGQVRGEASWLFNNGSFHAAAHGFRRIETLVSGGLKPLYHALADMSDGYGLWEQFHYRQAWEKLKTSLKALELASVWGGPPGLAEVLTRVKANVKFLESIVMDHEVIKLAVAYDLLAHAKRLRPRDQDVERATMVLLRALEAFAQCRLWKSFHVKSWDVLPDQLPPSLREFCQTCYRDNIDGKFKLPLQAQFQALAGFDDSMGKAFQANWDRMKPLLDASQQAILGHGFEPIKRERFQQLVEMVQQITQVQDASLPSFPHMNL